ncbi:hypothetical protein AGMMS49525_09340 [Bacteroidia bacterium]|nr:hypothetical protein AGMMS49525_09340 [Bacteroidia bacterium]
MIPEALRSGLNNIPKGIKEIISSMTKNVDVEKLTNTKIIGIISLVLASLSAIIVLYIILSFFSSGDLRFAGMLTGQFNLFVLYLHYGCLGWIITAIVLSGLAKFIPVFMKEEDNISEAGENIAGFAGGLAVLFLLAGIFARFIVGV